MGEKTGTRTKTGTVRRAALSELKTLDATAKLAEVVRVVNALILIVAPTTPIPSALTDAMAAVVTTKVGEHVARTKRSQPRP